MDISNQLKLFVNQVTSVNEHLLQVSLEHTFGFMSHGSVCSCCDM